MHLMSLVRRSGAVVAGAAAITVATASIASAHHCYKVDWQEAAYAHHVEGGTAWWTLSDLGAMIISEDIGLPQCSYVAEDVVAEFMEEKGLEVEPLIHSRATAGGGAAHQGKTVKPFEYLTQQDFVWLTAAIGTGIEECLSTSA